MQADRASGFYFDRTGLTNQHLRTATPGRTKDQCPAQYHVSDWPTPGSL